MQAWYFRGARNTAPVTESALSIAVCITGLREAETSQPPGISTSRSPGVSRDLLHLSPPSEQIATCLLQALSPMRLLILCGFVTSGPHLAASPRCPHSMPGGLSHRSLHPDSSPGRSVAVPSIRSPWSPFLHPPTNVQSGMGSCLSPCLASASLWKGDVVGEGWHGVGGGAGLLKRLVCRAAWGWSLVRWVGSQRRKDKG